MVAKKRSCSWIPTDASGILQFRFTFTLSYHKRMVETKNAVDYYEIRS
jgi:hypothetical protein